MNAAPNEPQPLSLFNADALILAAAVALILLIAAIAAVLSLRAKTRTGAVAGLACALLLMAFMPFLASLIWLWTASGPNLTAWSSSYLWLTFAAAIKLERVFSIGALLAGIVYAAIPGTHRASMLRTLGALATLVVVAVVYVWVELHRHSLVT